MSGISKEDCLKFLKDRAEDHIHEAKRLALFAILNENSGDQSKDKAEVVKLNALHDELKIAISSVQNIKQ